MYRSEKHFLSTRQLVPILGFFYLLVVDPTIALSQSQGKILLGPHIGNATIVGSSNLGTDKPSVRFERRLDDITETCARELASDDPSSSRRIASCVQGQMKIRQPVMTRRAWCSRSTIYTEFGNYSLVNAEKEPQSRIDGVIYKPIRSDWKDHKTDQVVGNCNGCNTPQLIDTFRILCPAMYQEWFSGYEPY